MCVCVCVCACVDVGLCPWHLQLHMQGSIPVQCVHTDCTAQCTGTAWYMMTHTLTRVTTLPCQILCTQEYHTLSMQG